MRLTQTAVIAHADVPNLNGRIYTREALETAIKRYENRAIMGQIGMPDNGLMLELDKVSHQVTNLHINERGELVGTIETLDTEEGCRLFSLLSQVPSMAFRTCGTGTLRTVGDETFVDDFEIASVNAVSDPA